MVHTVNPNPPSPRPNAATTANTQHTRSTHAAHTEKTRGTQTEVRTAAPGPNSLQVACGSSSGGGSHSAAAGPRQMRCSLAAARQGRFADADWNRHGRCSGTPRAERREEEKWRKRGETERRSEGAKERRAKQSASEDSPSGRRGQGGDQRQVRLPRGLADAVGRLDHQLVVPARDGGLEQLQQRGDLQGAKPALFIN